MSESSKKWYVLRAAGGKEKKAKEYLEKEIERRSLQDLVSQVLVPTEKVYKIRDGKRVCTERLYFPGYVLIEAELTGELQHIIRNEIPHMSGFLTEKRDVGKTQEKIPVPIREDEVRRILGEQDEQATTEAETVVDYKTGDAVKITDGPFNGFDGTVEEIVEDRSKLKVMVMIFGRKTILELIFTQVTKESSKIMAKEIAGFIKLQIKGGAANPSPPVGPALGSKGLNIMDFCKQFNARTQESAGKVLPVVITVYSDKSFTFEVKQPPVAVQLKEAAKISAGSAEPNRKKVGSVTWEQVKAIAETKMADMNCFTLKSAMTMVAGTARSMGIKVEGEFPEL